MKSLLKYLLVSASLLLVFYPAGLHAQKLRRIFPDSGTFTIDTLRSQPHYLPWLQFQFPVAAYEKKYGLLSAELDAFADSLGSVHFAADIYSLHLPSLSLKPYRRRIEAGLNFIFLRREKIMQESFFLHPYRRKLPTMDYFHQDIRLQRAFALRGGWMQISNPMSSVPYRFLNGGQAGIPLSIEYTDSHAAPLPYFFGGFGMVRKKQFRASCNQPGVLSPSSSGFVFFFADVIISAKKQFVPATLPYTDEMQDKPVYAAVMPAAKIPRAGFRIGMHGVLYKSHLLPFSYGAELGSYPGYTRRNSWYCRLSLGFRLFCISN